MITTRPGRPAFGPAIAISALFDFFHRPIGQVSLCVHSTRIRGETERARIGESACEGKKKERNRTAESRQCVCSWLFVPIEPVVRRFLKILCPVDKFPVFFRSALEKQTDSSCATTARKCAREQAGEITTTGDISKISTESRYVLFAGKLRVRRGTRDR